MTTQPRLLPEATITNMIEVAKDPIDALKLVADVYAMTAFRAERAAATAAGHAPPRPPKPRSNYLRTFTTGLRAKLIEIARGLDDDELERLKRIAPAVLVRMDRDIGLADEVIQLVCMAPDDAATWIREHVDDIEARFAS